ncbi:MAG TPA: zinc-ribbon domain-containing protein, partial [Dehalococcoidia bacterium]|nr:zinc-ribbon domain-containing protein [Dehalococcoidia bacterium]
MAWSPSPSIRWTASWPCRPAQDWESRSTKMRLDGWRHNSEIRRARASVVCITPCACHLTSELFSFLASTEALIICSSCQANNPDQAKFCMQCGAAQANTCPPCSTELPPEARFCFGCGHQIGEASTPPAVASTPVAPPEPEPITGS